MYIFPTLEFSRVSRRTACIALFLHKSTTRSLVPYSLIIMSRQFNLKNKDKARVVILKIDIQAKTIKKLSIKLELKALVFRSYFLNFTQHLSCQIARGESSI